MRDDMSKKPRAYLKRDFPPEPKMARLCLNCDREFMAEGRFNRICPRCKYNLSYEYLWVARKPRRHEEVISDRSCGRQ
jgi:predicted amidophosphoribosyltransferase